MRVSPALGVFHYKMFRNLKSTFNGLEKYTKPCNIKAHFPCASEPVFNKNVNYFAPHVFLELNFDLTY